MKRGYMTVYLALTLAVLVSFILALIEGARISATRMKALCAADVGISSTLSEYNKDLFEQYDLLMTDMTYAGGGSGTTEAVRHRLKLYLTMNLDESTPDLSRDLLGMRLDDALILEYALATDDFAEPVRNQVSDYMKTTLKGQFTGLFDDLGGDLSGAGFDYDTAGRRAEVYEEIDRIEVPPQENEEGELVEVPKVNPGNSVDAIRSAGIIGLCLNDTSDISTKTIDLSDVLTNRTLAVGDGISDEERSLSNAAGKITYCEYLFDKCGYYDNEKDGSVFDYEIEYIIKGHENDWDNLEAVCRTLTLWREGINFTYLCTDESKKAQAKAFAEALACVIVCPELAEPIMWSILLAWAYVESLQDVKILLEGDGVPVQKTAETWHTGMLSIFHPRSALKSYPGQEGAHYGDYLNTMLLMESYDKLLPRSLDIMELDVRESSGNGAFRMDACMQSFLVDITTRSTHGHNTHIVRRSGYYYP